MTSYIAAIIIIYIPQLVHWLLDISQDIVLKIMMVISSAFFQGGNATLAQFGGQRRLHSSIASQKGIMFKWGY